MPIYRKLHTKILDSYDFSEMPNDFTRVFWMLLIVVVDSEGRAIDNPAWIRSKMFPLRNDVSTESIENSLTWLYERKMIVRYQIDGRCFFCIPKFKKYQSGTEREAKSLLPAPQNTFMSDSGEGQDKIMSGSTTTASASATVYESESVNAYESESVSVNGNRNIFTLYESEIGVITSMIADTLKDAEKEYPLEWFPVAFKEAARHNARSWQYIEAILKRWKKDGFKSSNRKNGGDDGLHIGLSNGNQD